MASQLSLGEIIADLEAQIAFHREREAFHGERETSHREQRTQHAAALEQLTGKLETLKVAYAEAAGLVTRRAAAAPVPDPDAGRKLSLARMVARVVEARTSGQPFGISHVTAEVSRRYRDRFRKPVEPRLVSIVLRRMLAAGKLRSVRKGKPFHEALYSRV